MESGIFAQGNYTQKKLLAEKAYKILTIYIIYMDIDVEKNVQEWKILGLRGRGIILEWDQSISICSITKLILGSLCQLEGLSGVLFFFFPSLVNFILNSFFGIM